MGDLSRAVAFTQGARLTKVAPRATGEHSRWEVATRMAAIAAGAFVVIASRRGGDLACGSWIVGPDSAILARASEDSPIVSLDIDLSVADGGQTDLSTQPEIL